MEGQAPFEDGSVSGYLDGACPLSGWAQGKGSDVSEPECENTPSIADPRQVLINVALESWRFARLFTRVLSKLDAGEAPRFANQLRYYLKSLEEGLEAVDLKLVNLEGHPYDTGIAASALNIGDFAPEDTLIVAQMVEPIIMGADGVVRAGSVMLQKV